MARQVDQGKKQEQVEVEDSLVHDNIEDVIECKDIEDQISAVSYTHLTLPTILLV